MQHASVFDGLAVDRANSSTLVSEHCQLFDHLGGLLLLLGSFHILILELFGVDMVQSFLEHGSVLLVVHRVELRKITDSGVSRQRHVAGRVGVLRYLVLIVGHSHQFLHRSVHSQVGRLAEHWLAGRVV